VRYLIATTILLFTLPAAAQTCRDGRWKKVDGSPMMALRSNSCHYWAWSATQAKNFLSRDMLGATVLVTGDAHHENFSHMNFGGSRKYVPNDFDDAGEAPALLELFKFLAVSRSVQDKEKDLPTEDVINAYLKGINNQRYDGFPEWLEKDRSVTAAELAGDRHKDVDGREKDGEFKEKDDTVPWRSMPAAQRREFERLEQEAFASRLPRGFEVLDRAVKTKGERGGSSGLPRFWYLLRGSDGTKHILEFKELRQPAVWLYQEQRGSDLERLQQTLQIYWGRQLPPMFGAFQAGNRMFFMRAKLPNYTNFSADDFSSKERKFRELTGYIAFNLGRWHGTQLGARRVERLGWEAGPLSETAKKFVEEYLVDARREISR